MSYAGSMLSTSFEKDAKNVGEEKPPTVDMLTKTSKEGGETDFVGDNVGFQHSSELVEAEIESPFVPLVLGQYVQSRQSKECGYIVGFKGYSIEMNPAQQLVLVDFAQRKKYIARNDCLVQGGDETTRRKEKTVRKAIVKKYQSIYSQLKEWRFTTHDAITSVTDCFETQWKLFNVKYDQLQSIEEYKQLLQAVPDLATETWYHIDQFLRLKSSVGVRFGQILLNRLKGEHIRVAKQHVDHDSVKSLNKTSQVQEIAAQITQLRFQIERLKKNRSISLLSKIKEDE